MPPSRRGCAYRAAPVVKRPKKILTEEEKEDAAIKREVNKMLKEGKKEWEASLPKPWVEGPTPFRHHPGTMVSENFHASNRVITAAFLTFSLAAQCMFKSDAKKAYSLTEQEILTLPCESIPASPKTYYSHADVKAMQKRKVEAGALFSDEVKGPLRLLQALTNTGRRCKGNFLEVHSDIDPRVYEMIYGDKKVAPGAKIGATASA